MDRYLYMSLWIPYTSASVAYTYTHCPNPASPTSWLGSRWGDIDTMLYYSG